MDEDEIRAAADEELQALALEWLNSGKPIKPGPGYWEEMHRKLDEALERKRKGETPK